MSTVGKKPSSESRLLHDVLHEFGRGQNYRISRNNTGVAKFCAACERVHASERHPAYRVVKFGVPGAPDILGILAGGTAFGIETKSETGRIKPEQAAYHAMLERFGGRVTVVRSVAEASEWMKSIGAVWK